MTAKQHDFHLMQQKIVNYCCKAKSNKFMNFSKIRQNISRTSGDWGQSEMFSLTSTRNRTNFKSEYKCVKYGWKC